MTTSIMANIQLLAIFMAFGLVCGFYVSVVGFVISCVVILVGLGLANPFIEGRFVASFLGLAFVAMQVGYFVSVIARAIFLHVVRLRAHVGKGDAAEEMRAERDQSLL